MALPFALALTALVWALGALQLWPRLRWVGNALPWLAGTFALVAIACIALGMVGLVQHGSWGSPSTDKVVHALLGEGNLVMRRSDWPSLNLASNAYLQFDMAWTLLALCFACLHGVVFWSGIAERQRQARVRRARLGNG